ncbi:hypothetical protein Tco_0116479 [Tanacetum coccineum]
MSTSNTHQQSLVDVGSEIRPPMLKRGSPYVFKEIQPNENEVPRPKTEDDLMGDALKQYEADIEAINLILISIPNDIYNLVDARQTFNNEFDQFIYESGESLVSVDNQFAQNLIEAPYDDLFDYLQQYDKIVIASRAKKLEKTHDPLALVAHTSSSRSSHAYYVTHSPSVVDYDDEYQRETF